MGFLVKRDRNGTTVNVDMMLLYLVTFVIVVVGVIKAIRWAVTS
jgi:hypothetical protein